MVARAILPPGAAGYVYRVDCAEEGWSYVGQSARTDQDHVDNYYGSGYFIDRVLRARGTAGLKKHVIAVARTPVSLHYLEILCVAELRMRSVALYNGDLGGPRPFPEFQRHLFQRLPAASVAVKASDWTQFHGLIACHRALVEAAIRDAMAVSTDDFYAGLAWDLLTSQDLSYACPTCGSGEGVVCRTNAKSPGKPHHPARNHRARPTHSE